MKKMLAIIKENFITKIFMSVLLGACIAGLSLVWYGYKDVQEVKGFFIFDGSIVMYLFFIFIVVYIWLIKKNVLSIIISDLIFLLFLVALFSMCWDKRLLYGAYIGIGLFVFTFFLYNYFFIQIVMKQKRINQQ